VIQNTSHFVELVETGLQQKLIKNFFQDKEAYRRLKNNAKVLATQLKLHHELMLAKLQTNR
jgi:hypothetical protein